MRKITVTKPAQVVAKFLRKNGMPIGLAVAARNSKNEIVIGWSYTAKADRTPGRVNKDIAWHIALARLEKGSGCNMPTALFPIVDEVQRRAKLYFKTDRVEVA